MSRLIQVLCLAWMFSMALGQYCDGRFAYKETGGSIFVLQLESGVVTFKVELLASSACVENFDATDGRICCLISAGQSVQCWNAEDAVNSIIHVFSVPYPVGTVESDDILRISVEAHTVVSTKNGKGSVWGYGLQFGVDGAELVEERSIRGDPVGDFEIVTYGPWLVAFSGGSGSSAIAVSYRNLSGETDVFLTTSPIGNSNGVGTKSIAYYASGVVSYDLESVFHWPNPDTSGTTPTFVSATSMASSTSSLHFTSTSSSCNYLITKNSSVDLKLYFSDPQDLTLLASGLGGHLFLDLSNFSVSSLPGQFTTHSDANEISWWAWVSSPSTSPSPTTPSTIPCLSRQPYPPNLFTCYNDVWTLFSDLSTPTIELFGPTYVQGNVEITQITFTGLGSTLSTSQCANISESITLSITEEEYQLLTTGTKVVLVTQNCSAPSDLASLPIMLNTPKKGCQVITVTTEQDQLTGSLSALFKIDKDRTCKKSSLWWILLASIGGFVLITIIILALIFSFNDKARKCIRPYSSKK